MAIDRKRQTVTRYIRADCDLLYANTLKETIDYLNSVIKQYPDKNISLTENWLGYEDMEMSFIYDDIESDEEYESRIKHLEYLEKKAEEDKIKKIQREKDVAEYNRLRAKLGYY